MCSEVVAVALLAAAEDKETYSYGTGSCTVDTALILYSVTIKTSAQKTHYNNCVTTESRLT